MRYISTRGRSPAANFSDVLNLGLAPDGGLFLPQTWPRLDDDVIRSLAFLPYAVASAQLTLPFLDERWDERTVQAIFQESYQSFDHGAVIPLRQLGSGQFLLELFHGPTFAFKDLAMQVVVRLFDHALKRDNRRMTILGATSGDTGAAAIAASRGRQAIETVILFPHGRVSEMQRRQMTCLAGGNVHALAIDGSFDDCQALVKAMFNDSTMRTRYQLGAVNSINWARILVQSAYYIVSAAALGAPDRPVSFAVPSGNFGNAFSGYVAQRLGVPIKQIILGTNRNDALAQFFNSGRLKGAAAIPTLSPSMDIQIPSNLERFIYYLCGDGTATVRFMEMARSIDGAEIGGGFLSKNPFVATRCDDDETLAVIKQTWQNYGIIIDPHTAVGLSAANKLAANACPVIIIGTAHPAKFADAVQTAIGQAPSVPQRLSALNSMAEHVTRLPNNIEALQTYFKDKIEMKS